MERMRSMARPPGEVRQGSTDKERSGRARPTGEVRQGEVTNARLKGRHRSTDKERSDRARPTGEENPLALYTVRVKVPLSPPRFPSILFSMGDI